MSYLELSPMIDALRERPDDFMVHRGWLTHLPSKHSFHFDRNGNARLRAECDCALLSIRPEQGLELWTEFQHWRETYWRAVEINREFAGHFRRPNMAQRIIRRILGELRHILLDPGLSAEPPGGVTETDVVRYRRQVGL